MCVAIIDQLGGTLNGALAELYPLGEVIAVTVDVTQPADVTAI